ncbi:hypothetical protein PIROE2DRAFT_7936 [Piromyces sp. E2]|nr:hypothetical protein PIROE2DRAFT_7936 [Piromyces sp. E2]|eukprot:OUM65130.1 hypothetical protein PIROE2DRAFT_7936 [Piromyces sp. E2]
MIFTIQTINGIPLTKRNLEYIFAQSALIKLTLTNNEITDEKFPSGITFPTNLNEFIITNNKLTEVPDWTKTLDQKVIGTPKLKIIITTRTKTLTPFDRWSYKN